MAPQAFYQMIADIPEALAVLAPFPKAAVKDLAAPDLGVVAYAQATNGSAAAGADADRPRRVSARTNKELAVRRFSSSSSSNLTITSILISLLFNLLVAAAATAQDVIVFPKLGAVAEKIGEVAVNLGSAQLPIILHLVIHNTVGNNGHSCFISAFARHSFEKYKQLFNSELD